MPSDRMIEAIGRIERALSRIEAAAERHSADPAPDEASGIDQAAASTALRSLDALIVELKEAAHG